MSVTVLRVAVRYKGENHFLLFTLEEQSPAIVLRWKGLNWYHSLEKDS